MVRRLLFSLALVAALAVPVHTQAQVSATFDVTGSSGNWFLDFAFTNLSSAASGQYLYFMGADLPRSSYSSGPTGYGQYPGWSVGGNYYALNWLTTNYFTDGISPGSTVSGFVANVASVDAPTAVDYFGYTYNSETNPWYTGTARATVSVPEPGSMMLLATGLLGMIGVRRRRQDLTDDV